MAIFTPDRMWGYWQGSILYSSLFLGLPNPSGMPNDKITCGLADAERREAVRFILLVIPTTSHNYQFPYHILLGIKKTVLYLSN